MAKRLKRVVQMVSTNPTGPEPKPETLVDLSRSSFSVDVLRNDEDRPQVQEKIPTHLVSAVWVWNGARFYYGETS